MFNSLATLHKFGSRTHSLDFKPGPAPVGILSLSRLSEGLIIELHQMALMTAVAASGVNTMSGPDCCNVIGSLKSYALPDLTLIHNLKAIAVQSLSDGGDLDDLSEFLLALTLARQAFERFDHEIRTLGEGRAVVVHRNQLSGSWRHACQTAVAALIELEIAMAGSMPELFLQNHGVLNGLLNSAAQGFKPCMDAGCQLFVPPLPQQRRWPRQSVLQNCVLTLDGASSKAFVRDVSVGGLGLDRMPPLMKGTSLSVELEGGRRLTGSIVWSRNTSAGMKFNKPLLPSDPLIRG